MPSKNPFGGGIVRRPGKPIGIDRTHKISGRINGWLLILASPAIFLAASTHGWAAGATVGAVFLLVGLWAVRFSHRP